MQQTITSQGEPTMRTIEATITSQGQVTIPAEVRRKLGLTKREKVTFLIEDDRVELVPTRFTLESVFGSVEPLPNQSLDFDQEIEEAMADHADEVVRKLNCS
jgi:antitoxin PrlF